MRFFAGLILTICCFSGETFEGWVDTLESAQKVAHARHCPILIAFLGPNWCKFSDKLEEEILSQEAFKERLGEEMVFVKIDIPEDFEEKNFYGKGFKEAYGVEECPCVVLADENGAAIAKLEYLPITCHQFASNVQQLLSDYKRVSHLDKKELKQLKIDEIKHLYARAGHLADATFKQVLMDQGLKVDRGPYFLVEKYGSMLASGTVSERKLKRMRKKVVSRDPKNQQGCLRRLALIDFEASDGAQTPESVIEPLVQYLHQFGSKDKENAWRLELKISQYLYGKDRIEEALKHAKLSYQLAPPLAQKEIAHSIDYLEKRL